jgi:hypothetical protein
VKNVAVAAMRLALADSPFFIRYRDYAEGGVQWDDDGRVVLTCQELYSYYRIPRAHNFIAY